MSATEDLSDRKETLKTKILNRVIAKAIDFLIIGVLLEAVPKVGFFAGLIYLLIGDGLFDGRSIGKRLIKLKVVLLESGQACGYRESILRNAPFAVGYILMAMPLIGFVFPLIILVFESLLMLGDERGLRLGDDFAKTRVIEETLSDDIEKV
jgi:uncharacterized RDD family membrane protein YckC